MRRDDELELLRDLGGARGYFVNSMADGRYVIERQGTRCFRGTAAEAHRWLRAAPSCRR
jgi:hypothetical protein